MEKLANNHTTVILMMSDGTHRTSQWYREATCKQCWDFVRETLQYLKDGVTINEMFLASGVQSLRYTANEVLELAAKV